MQGFKSKYALVYKCVSVLFWLPVGKQQEEVARRDYNESLSRLEVEKNK